MTTYDGVGVSARVPELTLGWRLRMAAEPLTSHEMAERLGVNPATVSRWITGAVQPKRGMVRAWAAETGVDPAWLETGQASDAGACWRQYGQLRLVRAVAA